MLNAAHPEHVIDAVKATTCSSVCATRIPNVLTHSFLANPSCYRMDGNSAVHMWKLVEVLRLGPRVMQDCGGLVGCETTTQSFNPLRPYPYRGVRYISELLRVGRNEVCGER